MSENDCKSGSENQSGRQGGRKAGRQSKRANVRVGKDRRAPGRELLPPWESFSSELLSLTHLRYILILYVSTKVGNLPRIRQRIGVASIVQAQTKQEARHLPKHKH